MLAATGSSSVIRSPRWRAVRPPPVVPVLQASSVNAPETIAFLEGCRPDFVIARCKTPPETAVPGAEGGM